MGLFGVRFHGPDRRPSRKDRIRDGRPINGRREFPQSPNPRNPYCSQDQDTNQVFPRDPEELYEESFCDVTPDTGTNYPCTQKDLNASGGALRQGLRDVDKLLQRGNTVSYDAHRNNGPFIDARKAAREIFDHNDQKRTPSATENEALSRLIAGFEIARREPWGPDLAIKAFCDLDKVFFCGRLKGNVFLTWMSKEPISRGTLFGDTAYMGQGRCVIRMNAYAIFFTHIIGSKFVQMFGTLLHEMCHAYQFIRALESGPKGWRQGKTGGHGKNFGTAIQAVNERAWALLGLQGDPMQYPCHEYALDYDPHPEPRHSRPHIHTPPLNQSRRATSHMSRQELYQAAFADVTVDSGSDYACTQSDLEATGGLARQLYPEDHHKDRKASKRKWFSQPNPGPFITPRQASRDIFEHNDLRRKPHKFERGAIERLCEAIDRGRHGDWSPDFIIKAFCDLDIVFFGGQLRGHVCVRWQPNWSLPGETMWGRCVFLEAGKCAIRLNADTILLDHPRPLEHMLVTMLHEMCHADGVVRVHERHLSQCAGHGKNFGTKYYAVEKRAQVLFGLSLAGHSPEVFPRHKYEKGEGYP